MNSSPLVSVGVPTYNRPQLLKKMLPCILNQTYPNLEIIICDNSTPGVEVDEVVNSFMSHDHRIKYFKQEFNIGANKNFQFVLRQSTGEYFMWAADDDSWDERFIEKLINIIGSYSGAFCNYSVVSGSTLHKMEIQRSASGIGRYEQARNYLQERIPSMFYGLFKTKDIWWVTESTEFFDWFDCYLPFRIILLNNGFVLSKEYLYTADAGLSYVYKPMKPVEGKLFTYQPYIMASIQVIYKSKLSFIRKIQLFGYLLEVNFQSYLFLERMRKNHKLIRYLHRIYRTIIPGMDIQRIF